MYSFFLYSDKNNQHNRQSLTCILQKSNHFTQHYCVTLIGTELLNRKLIVKCHSSLDIDIFINDMCKATKHNNLMQSTNHKYHYITIQSNDIESMKGKIFVSVNLHHKTKNEEMIQKDNVNIHIQLSLLRNSNDAQIIITPSQVKQELKHRILVFRQYRDTVRLGKQEQIASRFAHRIKLNIRKKQWKKVGKQPKIIEQDTTKKYQDIGTEIPKSYCKRTAIKYEPIKKYKIHKLDISSILNQGKQMKLPLTTSRIRNYETNHSSINSYDMKLKLLRSIDMELDQFRPKKSEKRHKMIFVNEKIHPETNSVPIISPRATTIMNEKGDINFEKQIKIEYINLRMSHMH